MSRHLRSLTSSLRVVSQSQPALCRLERGRRMYFAMKTRTEEPGRTATPRTHSDRPKTVVTDAQNPAESSSSQELQESKDVKADVEESWNGTKASWKEADTRFAEHLNGLFPTLSFPPELARRILTHNSHPASAHGHNAAFSFMGRRVLESYLLLMLSSSKAVKPTHDLDAIVQRTLNSYVVGQHVGSKWGLGRKLRWTPTVSKELLKPGQDQTRLLRSVGLYKVQGDAVSAVIGGIFHQFGASVAHRVFHTRVLPLLTQLPKDGLPADFTEDARVLCERMGGPDGPLSIPDTSSPSLETQL